MCVCVCPVLSCPVRRRRRSQETTHDDGVIIIPIIIIGKCYLLPLLPSHEHEVKLTPFPPARATPFQVNTFVGRWASGVVARFHRRMRNDLILLTSTIWKRGWSCCSVLMEEKEEVNEKVVVEEEVKVVVVMVVVNFVGY